MSTLHKPSRRALIGGCASLLLPASAFAGGPDDQTTEGLTPLRCADFLASIGVNTHVSYAESQYGDVGAVLSALRYIGLTSVRDAAINSRAPNAGHYEALAAAGVDFCMFWGVKRTMADALEQIAALEAAHPGAVSALEGPNEIKPNFAYGGKLGNDAGRQFMADLRAGAAANPHLRRKPLVCFTTYAPVAADCDFANHHPYPKAGLQPSALLKTVRERWVGPGGVMPGKPMMLTEFGYHTLVGQPRPGSWQGVDPERQAIMLINGLLDNAAAGIERTYLYQLLDSNADTDPPAHQERHFGLFAFDGSPKPAASALKALVARLADGGARARAFSPARLPARVEVTAPAACLALRHSSGRGFLALWNERPIWNKETAGPLEIAPIAATISLERPMPMTAFDTIDRTRDKDFGTVRGAKVEIGAHPVILQIG